MASSATIKAVLASTPPALSISFGSEQVKEQGQHLPRANATQEPTISFPGAVPGKKYLAINIDLDAPFSSFPILAPICHWVKHDLSTSSPDGQLTSETPTLIQWGPPGPPPGAGPHRYVFALYEQPEAFTPDVVLPAGETLKLTGRMRFDFEGFEKKTGVGAVVAGGWFTSN
jgi:phosphatidylethanolamine-binding protein (PEBP) family uncharacterized protein